LRHNEQQMASIILAYGAGNPFWGYDGKYYML
jgi:hypothetical protein